MQPHVPRCSRTDAQARPPKSRENTTFSWDSMTDRQIGSCLAESSGRACKGRARTQNCVLRTSSHRPARARTMVKTQNWILIHTAHTREGMGHRGGLRTFAHTIPPARARARDGTSPQNWGPQRIQKWIRRRPARARVQSIPCIPSQIVTEKPPARDAMPTRWSSVSLSRRLGRDSRAFKSSAYMSICVRDSTGSKQGVGMGQTETNANCGRRWMPV